ncbi:hypothetical protein BJ508DRAFT_312367 [Ascobolus immersus RN42]|uniref:Uncharacterized protein n=1 Tax=Ascobolus immersus RN42 TaxID=1160509 RepID=A0A3N4HZA9_ASCIM|nr:hypothetical protein BJ508DRAFT_312367 [Ascobolus immersus RN42]
MEQQWLGDGRRAQQTFLWYQCCQRFFRLFKARKSLTTSGVGSRPSGKVVLAWAWLLCTTCRLYATVVTQSRCFGDKKSIFVVASGIPYGSSGGMSPATNDENSERIGVATGSEAELA